MGELEDVVDYFVIVESSITFSDQEKPLYMKENWDRYSRWHSKIIHHTLNTTGVDFKDTWHRETFQRNAMYDQVLPFLTDSRTPALNDIIIASDIDEIPRPDKLTLLRNCNIPSKITLAARFYYYSFQWQHIDIWSHPQATLYMGPHSTILPQDLRFNPDTTVLPDSAWHCSYCFAHLSDFVNKITSFSHQELNTPEFRDRGKILHRVRTGTDLFERENEKLNRVDVDEMIPAYVQKYRERYAYMLDRDPVDGNFEDYVVEDTIVPP